MANVSQKNDTVFFQRFDHQGNGGTSIAHASTGQLFKQQSIDRLAYIGEVNLPSGFWQATGEVGTVPTANVRVANKYTINAVDYTNSLELSKDFFDDNMHKGFLMAVLA